MVYIWWFLTFFLKILKLSLFNFFKTKNSLCTHLHQIIIFVTKVQKFIYLFIYLLTLEGSIWKGIYYISNCKSQSLMNYGKHLPFWPFAWTWEEFQTYSSCWILTLMFFWLAISRNCILKNMIRPIHGFFMERWLKFVKFQRKKFKLQYFCDNF
jgi:hypothetical protein